MVAVLFWGGLEMKVVRAQAQDGRVFRAVDGQYHVTGKSAGDPSYYRDFNRVGTINAGSRAQLDNPYRSSVWVQSAINQVTQPIKSVALKFYIDEVEVEDRALAMFWQAPAKGLSYEEFIDATAGWYKLAGEFFWILDDTWLSRRPGMRRSRFIVARPDCMRQIVERGELIGWEYKDGNGSRHFLLKDQVIQRKRWNPYNQWRGLGELDSAMMAAETDHLAAKYARDTFANMGSQGDYVIAKAGMPTDEQREQIINQLREKRAAVLRGDFRPVFLSGDIDVKSPAVTPPDAAFVANRLTNRHEVYIAFGVPPSMADIVASFSIGSASDYFRLIFNTCQPLAFTIAGGIDTLAQIMTGRPDVQAWFDWDDHPVMQQVRGERVDSAVKLFGLGMPVKNISEYLDMGIPRFAGDEQGYLPFSVSPVGGTLPQESDPALAEDTEQAPEDPAAMMIHILSNVRVQPKALPAPAAKARDPRRVAQWKQMMAQRSATSKAYESKFKKLLMEARAEVLRKIKENGPLIVGNSYEPAKVKAVAADFTFDLAKWKSGLLQEMRKVARAALNTAGEQLFEEVGNDDPFTMPPARALTFLKERDNRLTDVADEVFNDIKGAIQQSLNDGDSIAEMSKKIQGAFNDVSKARATRIAMTETSAAYGTARDEAMKQAGVEFKQWLTSGNDNVRESHLEAEGQTVALDEPFSVGGADLMFPGDPSGPPEEVINCHCVQIAVLKPAEEGEEV